MSKLPSSSPKKAAIEISQMLNAVLGEDRFPVDIEGLIYERTKNLEDPVTKIRKVSLDGFEGMLRPSGKRNEWHILYNENSNYPGRERFTLAHEFAHYLLDRAPLNQTTRDLPHNDSLTFECNPIERHKWKAEEVAREENADIFASYLLMPIDDFRAQASGQTIDMDFFQHIHNRYDVSLTAAILKWIEFTDLLAAMIVSRDGFALWGRASSKAYAKGVYVRSGMELPSNSFANKKNGSNGKLISIDPAKWNLWPRATATNEMAVYGRKIDQSISIILFTENSDFGWGEENSVDSCDRFQSPNQP